MNPPAQSPRNIATELREGGRWVLLHHTTPPDYPRGDHFDFMLEAQASLLTWACEHNVLTHGTTSAERLDDHRKAWLELEGAVSNNRGQVARIAQGVFDGAGLVDDTTFSVHLPDLGDLLFTLQTSPIWEVELRNFPLGRP